MPLETKPAQETTRIENDDESVHWNPLDENGVPYFDPVIDWGKETKEPDLDQIVRELEALHK